MPALVEDGTLQDLGSVFFDLNSGNPVTLPEGLTIRIQSKTNGSPDVPEPATLALMAAGLVGLDLRRRRGIW